MGSAGASIQVFRNVAFSAPMSFLALASLRQAVRFTCLAAASPATVEGAAATVAAEAGVVGAAAGAVDAGAGAVDAGVGAVDAGGGVAG